MQSAPLKIYKSSAGSGKTFTLVKEYLRICLPQPERFRNIIAITFTNAAAAEMKDRILRRLEDMCSGKDTELSRQLLEEGMQPEHLANAPRLLENILYNYTYFNVSTIDSFFHKILRAFNKELELPADFDIFLDTAEALDYAVDNFLYRTYMQPEAHRMLVAFIREKINNGTSWQVQSDLYRIAQELVKDSALQLPKIDLTNIREFIGRLHELRLSFENRMDELGCQALSYIESVGLGIEDFKYGKSGPAGYFSRILRNTKDYEPKQRFLKGLSDESEWFKKNDPKGRLIEEALHVCLLPVGLDILDLYESSYASYVSVKEVLRNIYTFSVYEQVGDVLQEYRVRNNVVLVSDFTRILSAYVLNEDIDFVYSKLGSRLEHYLIDEFQDTSRLQWLSLKPLVENAVSQGADCLVVGDSKQAIYRWRGGEVELLETQLSQRDFPGYVSQVNLSQNFRSKSVVVSFNNNFFQRVGDIFVSDLYEYRLLSQIFNSAAQEAFAKASAGYVEVHFFTKESMRRESFCEKSRSRLLETVQQCLAEGYSYKDLTILVRDKKDASDMARLLFKHNIPFITQDSLYLDQSPVIRLLLSLLHYINDMRNELVRTQVVFLYLRYFKPEYIPDEVPFTDILLDFNKTDDGLYLKALPQEFTQRTHELSLLPVYELVEELVRIFNLGREPDAYLQRFQDVVLEYSQQKSYGIMGFLDSWKEKHFTVVLPEDQDAIQIMTIHKSKGLEFPVVLIPYADWDFSSGKPDMLWVHSDAEPFNDFPQLPVFAGPKLKESLFADDYLREEALTAIDNLNLLYVAFTRARERLYIFTELCSTKPGSDIKSIDRLINMVLLPEAQKEDIVLRYGESQPVQLHDIALNAEQAAFISMGAYPSSNWRDIIYLDRDSENSRLQNILRYENALAYLKKTQGGDLFAQPDKISLRLGRLLSDTMLSRFYEASESITQPASLCLPGYGLYAADRQSETKKDIYLLKIAGEGECPAEEDALGMYKAYLQKETDKQVNALLIDLEGDKVRVL